MSVASEIKRRINVSVWAYSYEFNNISIVDDATFDKERLLIKPRRSTGNFKMDKFFREKFTPCTGLWVRQHPEIEVLESLVEFIRGEVAVRTRGKIPLTNNKLF